MNDEMAVRNAVDRWFLAVNAMLNGDPTPFAALYSHADDVTYMGAEGTYRVGWDATYADWKTQAEQSAGGSVEGIDVHVVVNGDMATASHYTKGSIKDQKGRMSQTSVRETSVLRREDGQWRMIGHHADVIPFWEMAFDK
jgi:uncharacterized protein (TIGR02246 family)